jgi:hypothetical protein
VYNESGTKALLVCPMVSGVRQTEMKCYEREGGRTGYPISRRWDLVRARTSPIGRTAGPKKWCCPASQSRHAQSADQDARQHDPGDAIDQPMLPR